VLDAHSTAIEHLKTVIDSNVESQAASDKIHRSILEHLHSLEKESNDTSLRHASMNERCDSLERSISEWVSKHAKDLEAVITESEAIRLGNTKLATELQAIGGSNAQHVNIGEHIQQVEKILGDSVDRVSESVAAAHARLDQLHSRVSEEKLEACQRRLGLIDGLLRREVDERAKEDCRIWDALDSHTHNLATSLPEADSAAGGEGKSLRRAPSGAAPLAWPSPPSPVEVSAFVDLAAASAMSGLDLTSPVSASTSPAVLRPGRSGVGGWSAERLRP